MHFVTVIMKTIEHNKKEREPIVTSRVIAYMETSLNLTHFLVLELKLAISSWESRERLRTWRT